MSAPRHRRLLAAICLGLLALVGSTASAAPRPAPTLLAVGDVASCDSQGDERVAELVARTPGTIALLGDIVYDNGTADEFARCFMPAWAPMLPRIRRGAREPRVRERRQRRCSRAGDPPALIRRVVLVRPRRLARRRPQLELRRRRRLPSRARGSGSGSGATSGVTERRCVLLPIGIIPRFSSGEHGSDVAFSAFWSLLAAARGRRRPGGPRPRLRTLRAHGGYQVVRRRDRWSEPAGIRPSPCGERRAAEHVVRRPPARSPSSLAIRGAS